MEDGGSLRVREEVILGRHGEVGGAYRGRLRVDVGGAPLLRHELVLDGADPATTAVAARASGSILTVGPVWLACDDPVPGPDVAALALAPDATLTTALAEDALWLRRRLDPWLPTARPAVALSVA